ncbi:MAG: hypothetical protein F4Z51_01015 [Chloroflexi bacterium]|nr:hypothetical protein [Chloroflexota bacterium]
MRRLWPALLVPLTLSSMLLGGALAGAEDDEPLTLAVTATRETCTLGSVTTLDYHILGGLRPTSSPSTVNPSCSHRTRTTSLAECRRPGRAWGRPAVKTSSG